MPLFHGQRSHRPDRHGSAAAMLCQHNCLLLMISMPNVHGLLLSGMHGSDARMVRKQLM
jgi:hypothetical protein